jgi:hypothetical protein
VFPRRGKKSTESFLDEKAGIATQSFEELEEY